VPTKPRSYTLWQSALLSLLVFAVILVIATWQSPFAALVFFLCASATLGATYALLRSATSALRTDRAVESEESNTSVSRQNLVREKAIVLAGIRELDADFGTGKVDAADYAQLRKSAALHAGKLIQSLDTLEASQAQHRAELLMSRLGYVPAAITKSEGATEACGNCHQPRQPDWKFCIHCGSRNAAEEVST
jgi:glucose-6-phosphate-specific signal transduction histidine kinase